MLVAEDVTPVEITAPHELLGVAAGECDPVRIVGAAARRLRLLDATNGSEATVRLMVADLIRRARDQMLRATAGELRRPE